MRKPNRLLIIGFTALGLLANTPAPAQAAKKPSPIVVAPSFPPRNSEFVVTGTMPTKVVRPVKLERKSDRRWLPLAFAKTDKAGRYRLTSASDAPVLTIRVVAKKVKIRGKWYPGITTQAKVVRTQGPPPTASGRIETVQAGYSHTCRLTAGGAVSCWGTGASGELGDGTMLARSTPNQPAGLSQDVAAITLGWSHACALTKAGAVKCWGHNWGGELADGTRTNRRTPVQVVGLTSGIVTIAAGYRHTCAIDAAGTAKCWGAHSATPNVYTPTPVNGLTGRVITVASGGSHDCALLHPGEVRCWGHNTDGQLGNNSNKDSATPVPAAGLGGGVMGISAGYDHNCVVTSGGAALCWGRNDSGQLGDGTTTGRAVPTQVVGLTQGVVAISAGEHHTCAVIRDGNVKCWGANDAGQLGDGTTTGRPTPTLVVGLAASSSISVGEAHTCAVTTTGRSYCWGNNRSGQLGDGTWTNRLTPTPTAR